MSISIASRSLELTVCVCTRNRPESLTTTLESIRLSEVPAQQIIVSDDSTDERTKLLVQQRFADVDFVEGPRRGLCANRNAALERVRGTHVLFIDDDATLGRDFVEKVSAALAKVPAESRMRTIVSGLERQGGQLVYPNDQNFLGYLRRGYHPAEPMNTIVINATIFPRNLFERIGFDKNLVYGYDEVDISTRAVAHGYRITICPDAVNDHFPSLVNRDYYETHLSASRLYVTLKRYMVSQHDYRRAVSFVVVAPLHLTASLIKRKGLRGVGESVSSVVETVRYFVKYVRQCPDAATILSARQTSEPIV